MIVLGKDVDVVDSTARDIQAKEQRAWTTFHKLKPILRQRTAVRHRFRILHLCVIQAFAWAAETWILTKARLTHFRGLHTRWLKAIVPCPGALQGLDDQTRHLEYTRHVRQLLDKNGFPLLDVFVSQKMWKWAGHIARLPTQYPGSWWLYFKDVEWWRRQQQNPQGPRHLDYDANLARWENLLVKYSSFGPAWKRIAQNREVWNKGFPGFLQNLRTVGKRARTESNAPATGPNLEEPQHEQAQVPRSPTPRLDTQSTKLPPSSSLSSVRPRTKSRKPISLPPACPHLLSQLPESTPLADLVHVYHRGHAAAYLSRAASQACCKSPWRRKRRKRSSRKRLSRSSKQWYSSSNSSKATHLQRQTHQQPAKCCQSSPPNSCRSSSSSSNHHG